MHLLLTIIEREISAQLLGVPSRAQLRGRLPVVHSKRVENTPQFLPKVLQLKAQAPDVSDNQVIAQAIKALRVGPLHSHLVRE
jgi:hypothetical protein